MTEYLLKGVKGCSAVRNNIAQIAPLTQQNHIAKLRDLPYKLNMRRENLDAKSPGGQNAR